MKNQATPRPWQIGLDSEGTSIEAKINGNWYPICDVNFPMILELGYDNAFDIQEKNAKLIVKSCNNYDNMLSLIKQIINDGGLNEITRARASEIINQDSQN